MTHGGTVITRLTFEGLGWLVRLQQKKTNFFLTLAREVALGSALRKGDPLHYYLVTCEDRKAILVFLDGQQKPKGEVVKLRGTSFLVRH